MSKIILSPNGVGTVGKMPAGSRRGSSRSSSSSDSRAQSVSDSTRAAAGIGASFGSHREGVSSDSGNSRGVSYSGSGTGVYGLPAWYISAFSILVISIFGLIALGGSVRLMNAGLACPDWPLCFGDVIPDYHPQVYFEFIHRVLAGLVMIATTTLFIFLWRSRVPRVLKQVAVGAMILLLTQAVFGGLTVLLALHSKVVAAHLGMGTGFFALMLWIYLNVKNGSRDEAKVDGAFQLIPRWVRVVAVGLLLAVYGQILLGGLVASHFASLVCTDFPTCHGEWFPTFSGIIGLHVIHRLGAYTVFTLILAGWLVLRSRVREFPRFKMLGAWMFALVCMQVVIGIANVLLHTPPVIAVAHLAVGTAILGIAVRLLFEASSPLSMSAKGV